MRSTSEYFKGKNVVVTGASAGIGRAICNAFASAGANLAVISRNEERLITLSNELASHNTNILILPLDVASAADVENAAARTETELGAIDIWINNAMVSVFSPIKEMTAEEYKRVTEVTYLGVVYGTLSALKRMLPRNEGTIIQVGSALAYRGIPLQSAYCAAKHAIQGFHDSLLVELIHDKSNVKTTMVQLSAHNTPQFEWVKSRLPNKAQPVPPIYQPEVAARAVLWAAQHYRREYIVGFPSWKGIVVNKFMPGLADKFLAGMGYESQQTTEPRNPEQLNDLFQSVPGSFGAHGRFDESAIEKDFFWEVTKLVPFSYILIVTILLLATLIIVLTR